MVKSVPGGGKINMDLIVRTCFVSGALGLMNRSDDQWLEVCYSPSLWLHYRGAAKSGWVFLNGHQHFCLSQMPPVWLEAGVFIINSHPNSLKSSWSISIKVQQTLILLRQSLSLDQILFGVRLPEWQQDEVRAFMKASVVNSLSISMCIALGTHARN